MGTGVEAAGRTAAGADHVAGIPDAPWRLTWRRFRRDVTAMASATAIVVLVALVTVGGPIAAWILGHEPDAIFPDAIDATLRPVDPWTTVRDPLVGIDGRGATALLPLGADPLGRDELLRLLYGGRVSLLVAVGGTLLAMAIGVVVGSAAAYFGGIVDSVVSRLTELTMAFPLLFLIILLASTVGDRIDDVTLGGLVPEGVVALVLIIGCFTWFYPARIMRTEIASLREREFVEAARSIGASDSRIMRKHLLPYLVTPIIVYSALLIPTNILLEAGISFLGFGVPLPTSSWGNLLAGTWGSVRSPNPDPFGKSPWLTVFPSIAIFVSVLAFNLFGEGLRAAADPGSVRQ